MPRPALRSLAAATLAAALLATGCAGQHPGPGASDASQAAATPVTPAATSTSTVPAIAAAAAPSTTAAASAPSKPPAPNPCRNNRSPKRVLVKLDVQQLWMCRLTRVVYGTPITSGVPGRYTSTPTGSYVIQARTRDTTLTLIDGRTYAVKYWIPFDAPLFGFHDSSWQDFPYGSPRYKQDGSHGCIHMPLQAIRFLYNWGDVGTSVRIRA